MINLNSDEIEVIIDYKFRKLVEEAKKEFPDIDIWMRTIHGTFELEDIYICCQEKRYKQIQKETKDEV